MPSGVKICSLGGVQSKDIYEHTVHQNFECENSTNFSPTVHQEWSMATAQTLPIVHHEWSMATVQACPLYIMSGVWQQHKLYLLYIMSGVCNSTNFTHYAS